MPHRRKLRIILDSVVLPKLSSIICAMRDYRNSNLIICPFDYLIICPFTKRLISSIDAEISNMQQRINAIPKGDPSRIQLLDRIAEKTVALGLLQEELRMLTW